MFRGYIVKKMWKREAIQDGSDSKQSGLSRRQFLLGAAVGGTALLGAGAFGSLFRDVTDEEFHTFYVGDDEECEEVTEHVTAGELCAHIGCAIALSAVDNDDYNSILNNLGLYGTSAGLYTYDNGRFMNYLHSDPAWCAKQPYYQAGRTDNKRGDIFTFGLDEMPNRSLPNANNYINWIMGKGLRAEYGEYIAPEALGLTPDYANGAYSVAPAYASIVARNQKNVNAYGTFAQCGAIPPHIHQAINLKIDPLWDYFNRMVNGESIDSILPTGSAELEDYWIYRYDHSLSFDEQMKPGDMFVWAAPERPRHFAMYVGNEIAKRYFPNTTGNVCEAGAGPDHFCGITKDIADRYAGGLDYLFICRPKNIEIKLHQDLPPLKLNKGCDESCRPLTLGEKMAHCGAGTAMTASGQEDYVAMLKSLDLFGKEVGKFDYVPGDVINICHVFKDPVWRARQDPYLLSRGVRNSGCACYFDNVAPNPRIPRAQTYIEFTMGKGVLPEYGVYIPEEVVREEQYRDQVEFNCKHLCFSEDDGVYGYSRFCMCGTAVGHIVWACGAPHEGHEREECHGGRVLSDYSRPDGNRFEGGYTNNGIRYEAHGPSYCFVFPDHIYGKGSPIRGKYWDCWSLDWTRPIDDQCLPGDFLCIGPAWDKVTVEVGGGYMPADYKKAEHGLMYIGNDVVTQYFPNSNANIGEAGGSGRFWGLKHVDKLPEGYRIYRVHDLDVEPRQWVPPIPGCRNQLVMA